MSDACRYTSFDPTPGSTHNLVLQFVPAGSRVLEFGCATGYMSEALKSRLGCSVVGVEISEEAAAAARRRADEVIVGDAEVLDLRTALGDRRFDVILFADVLEHLRDPRALLDRMRAFLAEDGVVIASVPNVAHGSVRLALLAGEFRYRELGLLDDTHLRFFTRASVQDLFEAGGYVVTHWRRKRLDIDRTEIEVPDTLPDAAVEAVLRDPEATTYQFVVRAVPSDAAWQLRRLETELETARAEIVRLRTVETENERLERVVLAAVEGAAAEAHDGDRERVTAPNGPRYGPDAMTDDDGYHTWLGWAESGAGVTAEAPERPVISVVVPVYRPELDLLHACIASIRTQSSRSWELCLCDDGSGDPTLTALLDEAAADPRIRVARHETNAGISAATNSALELATGDFVGFLDQDDELAPEAIAEAARVLAEHSDIDVLYTDEDKIDTEGRHYHPFLKPDWSPDYLLSSAYMCHFLVIRRTLVEEVGGLRSEFDGSQDYDLMLRATERARRVAHVPRILYHWRAIPGSAAAEPMAKPWAIAAGRAAIEEALARRGERAEVVEGPYTGIYGVRRTVEGEPLVSVVVPFRDGAGHTRRCIDALHARAGHDRWQAVLVDNGSWEPETEALVARLTEDPRCRVLEFADPFNWAAINNWAAEQADGELLLFLNNDVEGISDGWLRALVEHAQRPEVGAVGARLLYPSGRVQHAGVILGLGGIADHAFRFCPSNAPGYFGMPHLTRNWSAVTGACMMVRHDVFSKLGGFDERLAVAYNDIDLCLRLSERGYLIVYTPFAELVHDESMSRGYSVDRVEVELMLDRWGDLLERGDPYFNPNLSLNRTDFSLPTENEVRQPWKTLVSTLATL